jgi:hypothetical protein
MKTTTSLNLAAVAILFPALCAWAQTSAPQPARPFQGTISARAGEDGTTFDFYVGPKATRIDIREAGQKKVTTVLDTAHHEVSLRVPDHNLTLRFPLPELDLDEGDDENDSETYEFTGRQSAVAGVPCSWVRIQGQGARGSEACVTRGLGSFARLGAHSRSWPKALIGGQLFPLKVVEHRAGGDVVSWLVTRVEAKGLDPSIFAVPSNAQFSLGFDVEED